MTLQDDGTDWGARINAADAKLGRNTGTIQVNGGGNIATQIVISSCHVLSFGPGRWTNAVRQNAPLNCRSGCETILLKDHTTVQGAGMSQTIIMENNDIPYHYNNPSYTVITTYTERAGNPGQITESYDIILHDFQISGIGIDKHCSNQDGSYGKGGNGTNSVIFLGFLNDGRVQNIKEVQTHAIGLTIGESNMDCPPRCPQHYNYARNVIVTGCEFINVGGGAPIPNNTSGGVSLAIINGLGITIANNVFHDAWGAGFIDIEPNNPADFTKDIKIDHNTMIQDAATGKALFGTYAITIHGIASQEGPYTITNNRIEGAWRNAGGGQFQQTGYMVEGIDTNYGGFRDTNGFDIENNLIKYTSNDGIVLNGTNNSTVKNNTIVMAGYNLEVYGHNNLIQGNTIQTNNTGDLSTYTGIEEGQQPNTHDNQFINNRATGIVFVKHRVTYTPPKFPVYIVGRNSTGRGNVLIPRPAWPI